jgi:hypothetical protein
MPLVSALLGAHPKFDPPAKSPSAAARANPTIVRRIAFSS